MRTIRFVLTFLLVTMLLSLVIGSSTAKALGSEPPKPQLSSNGEWSTFTHPDFGFSFSYPANWYLTNDLSLGNPRSTTSVQSVHPKSLKLGEHGVPGAMTIEIGLHLVEWDETVTPREWTNAYDYASLEAIGGPQEREEIEVHRVVDLEVDGYPAVRKTATSPALTYDYVTVQRGKMMWFIWSNVAPEYPEVFEQVVQSFHWSDKNIPQSFSDIGIYVPRSKLNVSEKQFVSPTKETTKEEIIEKVRIEPPSRVIQYIPPEPPGHRMPFDGGYFITAGNYPHCGSPKHYGRAALALDFGTPKGTFIRNSSGGDIIFNDFSDDGYGLMVGVQDFSNRRAYYAHLDKSTWKESGYISKGSYIGEACQTGCSPFCGAHLHFHVRATAPSYTPIDITGIPTMTWYDNGCSGNPDGWAQH